MAEQSEKGEKEEEEMDKISKNSIMPLYVLPCANYSKSMQLTHIHTHDIFKHKGG